MLARRWWASLARWGALSALLGGSLGLASTFRGLDRVSLIAFGDGSYWMLVDIAASLHCLLGIFGLYGALHIAHSDRPRVPMLALAGAVVAALAILSNLALVLYVKEWGTLSFLVLSWWEVLLLYAADPLGWSVGLALLGVSAARERSFGALLRVLPLVAAVLYPAGIVLNLLVNVAVGTSGVDYWPIGLTLYQPFLGSALLGCALLTASLGGSSTPYSLTFR
jgi:hypothetical protein